MRSRRTLLWAGLLGAIFCPFASAQEDADKQDPKKESRTEFVRRLFDRNKATYGDACRAVLALGNDAHSDADFEAIQNELLGKGVVDKGWKLKESSPVTLGMVAYMLCKTLDIKGGLTVRIIGWSRRYAFRECLYLGLIPRGSQRQFVTGRQLIDILGNAEIYKEQGSLDSVRK